MTLKIIFFLFITGALLLSFSVFFIGMSQEDIIHLAREDGLYETTGAISFFLAALMYFTIFIRERNHLRLFDSKNISYFVLGSVFLVAFLEEISWGQRIFDLRTPDFLQRINKQNEINIHNTGIFSAVAAPGVKKIGWPAMFSANRMFSYFWFSYCCLLPITYRFHAKSKIQLKRFNFPVVPIFVGVFFLINYILPEIIITLPDMATLRHSLIEIKECNMGVLFFLTGAWFLIRHRTANQTASR